MLLHHVADDVAVKHLSAAKASQSEAACHDMFHAFFQRKIK